MLEIKNLALRRLLSIFLIACCLVIVIRLSIYNQRYQWDFRTYYYAAKAHLQGMNPYDTDELSQLSGSRAFPYVYSPLTLFFFHPFARLNYNTAYYLYFFLKCALLFGLIILWRNGFLSRQVDLIFYILCLLAFNCAIYLDLRAGNISIIEQFVIWLGLFYYMRQRLIIFCVLIVIIATFKIQPILLLLLLLLSEDKKKYLYLSGSFIVFALILSAVYINNPSLFNSFIANASGTLRLIDLGIDNPLDSPSTFLMIKGLGGFFSKSAGIALGNKICLAGYLAIIAAVGLISLRACIFIKSSQLQEKNKWIILFVCLVYVLASIRFKDYSYIILILPAYFIISRAAYSRMYIWFFLIAIIPSFKQAFYFLGGFYPLLVAYFIWILYLRELFSISKQRAVETSLSQGN